MPKFLLAVDGSDNSIRATRRLIEAGRWMKDPLQVELVTVTARPPKVGPLAGAVLSQQEVDRYCAEQGEQALAPARTALEAAGVPFKATALIGEIASSVVDHAQGSGCEAIWMGSRGLTSLSNFLLGSVTTRVLSLARVPVTVVP